MLAANPITVLRGDALALQTILPDSERLNSVTLYWGMSTDGAFLYPLAKQGNYALPYDRSALRVRERGIPDCGGFR